MKKWLIPAIVGLLVGVMGGAALKEQLKKIPLVGSLFNN